MMIAVVDDGHMLGIAAEGHACSLSSSYERFARRTGESALRRQMQAYLQQLAKNCPRMSRAQVQVYAQAFAAAGDDFDAGVEALKKRASRVFKRDLAGCRPRRFDGAIVVPYHPFEDRCDGVW